MKLITQLSTALFALSTFVGCSQTDSPFGIELEPMTITNAPGIQSYSHGLTTDGKWLIIGGRIEGLHERQPFASFGEEENNKFVFVIDPIGEQSWSADLSVLSSGLYEQLQATNHQFYQDGNTLYITGGYGFSTTNDMHMTYPNLTAIAVDELASAVINNTDITAHFRQITDNRLKVTGGQLEKLDSTFYLVGGHLFDGSYNPMGPDHGPGFTQIYTNDIRKFKVDDDGSTMIVYDYSAEHDTINLHRRDYNMSPQVFPDGSLGFTAFSGVFDYNDMPYLNAVNINENGYEVVAGFSQYLSQYHSAKLPVYDTVNNRMHTLFFGGLSQFTMDAGGNLVEDVDVPFVNTISRVSRNSSGAMEEVKLNYIEMPALLGAGAEFIPIKQYFYDNGVLNLSDLPSQKTLVGYIYGGIESSEPNIFFINDGTQSIASNTIFKVYINKSVAGLEEQAITNLKVYGVSVYPNPAKRKLNYSFFSPTLDTSALKVIDVNGKVAMTETHKPSNIGAQEGKLDISSLSEGMYTLLLENRGNKIVVKFQKR